MNAVTSDVPKGPSQFASLSVGDFASRTLDQIGTGGGFDFFFFSPLKIQHMATWPFCTWHHTHYSIINSLHFFYPSLLELCNLGAMPKK